MASTTCELKYSSPYIYTLLHWYNAFSLIYTYRLHVKQLYTHCRKNSIFYEHIYKIHWGGLTFLRFCKNIFNQLACQLACNLHIFFFFYQGFRNMHACNSSLSFLENYAFRTFHDVPTWEISNIPIISLLSRFILLWLIF